MKMPKPWHLLFPVRLADRDRFGLPRPFTLESETDRQRRIDTVEQLVADVFKTATLHLGEQEARQLFARAASRRKRGKRKRPVPDRDSHLLKEYDSAARSGETIVSIAKRLDRDRNLDFGSSAEAIERQIHKVVKERRQRDRAQAVQTRRWRMANRHVRTVLGSADSEK